MKLTHYIFTKLKFLRLTTRIVFILIKVKVSLFPCQSRTPWKCTGSLDINMHTFLPQRSVVTLLCMFSYLLTSGQNLCTLLFYHLEHMDLFKCKLQNIGSGQEWISDLELGNSQNNIQSDSVNRGPKLLSIKNYVIMLSIN